MAVPSARNRPVVFLHVRVIEHSSSNAERREYIPGAKSHLREQAKAPLRPFQPPRRPSLPKVHRPAAVKPNLDPPSSKSLPLSTFANQSDARSTHCPSRPHTSPDFHLSRPHPSPLALRKSEGSGLSPASRDRGRVLGPVLAVPRVPWTDIADSAACRYAVVWVIMNRLSSVKHLSEYFSVSECAHGPKDERGGRRRKCRIEFKPRVWTIQQRYLDGNSKYLNVIIKANLSQLCERGILEELIADSFNVQTTRYLIDCLTDLIEIGRASCRERVSSPV